MNVKDMHCFNCRRYHEAATFCEWWQEHRDQTYQCEYWMNREKYEYEKKGIANGDNKTTK